MYKTKSIELFQWTSWH